MTVTVYKVVSTIWHTKENRYYEPGDIVDLSHLDGFALSALLKSGAVVVSVETAKEKKAAAAAEEEAAAEAEAAKKAAAAEAKIAGKEK